MSNPTPSIARLAHLARERSRLMASLLAAYQEQQRLDDASLATLLGCDVQALPRLALCRRPRPAPHFRTDIDRIAAYVPCDPRQLAVLIRAVESWLSLRQAPSAQASLLLAARDREDLEHAEPGTEERPSDERLPDSEHGT